MIQVKNLTITHRKDLRILLWDFSMVLNQGDKAALIGEEGDGKSTLMKLLYQEELVEHYIEYQGEIIRNHAKIGYLAQELTQNQKEKSIYDFCIEGDDFFNCSPGEIAQIENQLFLSEGMLYSDQKMGQLSGGEKVKVQIARILIGKPDVLFLDEPSNDIDLETLKWLEEFICKSNLPILFISHDEMLLENTANKIIHLEQIQRKTKPRWTVAANGYREYMENRKKGMAHQEQIAKNERIEYKKQREKFLKIQQKVEYQQAAISRQDPHGGQLLKKRMHVVKAQERRMEKKYQDLTEIPETEDAILIRFGEKAIMPHGKRVLEFYRKMLYHGERILTKDLRLTVIGPEHIGIVGKNGVGKTTFIREIWKELKNRQDIQVFYMPQNYEELLDEKQTPVEFLAESGKKEEISKVRTYLGSMKYTADEMSHPIWELSGGQKAKLLFLKMSMAGSDVLLLDEPTRNFSPLSNPVIRQLLREFKGTIISVSHDRKYIQEVCMVVYELTENGLSEVSRK